MCSLRSTTPCSKASPIPSRLGVGGWSYGGILTNSVISKDTRFKSATSGAVDLERAGGLRHRYVHRASTRPSSGTPWQNLDVYLHNSLSVPARRPHQDADAVPCAGSEDFNVPLLNSEQMYQALRSLGIETQLVIYPDQYHGLTKPSYLRDRMQRYLDWHGKFSDKPRGEITAR